MFTTTIISAFNNNANLLIQSDPFPLSEEVLGSLGITINSKNLPSDSRTGKLIIQGVTEMAVLQATWPQLISFAHFKDIHELQLRRYHWAGHAMLDQMVYVRFDASRYEPALGCFNVWWDCSLVDAGSHNVLCSYQRCQRWYTE
jgi:hypothetical protein